MKTSKIRMVQVTDRKTILTWYRKFAKEHFGHDEWTYEKRQISVLLDTKICKYVFAFRGRVPLGFIRMTSVSSIGKFPMWCIQDAFIRESSRSQGLLKMLLEKCRDDYRCGYLLLSVDRAEIHSEFYKTLGFIGHIDHPHTDQLQYLATREFVDSIDSYLTDAA